MSSIECEGAAQVAHPLRDLIQFAGLRVPDPAGIAQGHRGILVAAVRACVAHPFGSPFLRAKDPHGPSSRWAAFRCPPRLVPCPYSPDAELVRSEGNAPVLHVYRLLREHSSRLLQVAFPLVEGSLGSCNLDLIRSLLGPLVIGVCGLEHPTELGLEYVAPKGICQVLAGEGGRPH